jgi:GNAT superfamily N-acetyltransferase
MTTWSKDGYRMDDDPRAVDRDLLFHWLSTDTYWWAAGLERGVLEAALDGSTTLSVRDEASRFVAFARLVTDRATFAWLCDVYVDREHRGRGLGSWLTAVARDHPGLSTCRRLLLVTRDAHGVYAGQGFSPLAAPGIFMELVRSAPAAPAGRDPGPD